MHHPSFTKCRTERQSISKVIAPSQRSIAKSPRILRNILDSLSVPAETITFRKTRHSPAQSHRFYNQTLMGIKISDAWLRVDMDANDSLGSFHSRLADSRTLNRMKQISKDGPKNISEARAVKTAKLGLTNGLQLRVRNTEICLRKKGRAPYVAWKVSLYSQHPVQSWDVYVDAKKDSIMQIEAASFSATGRVFNPNPMVSLGNFSLRPGDTIPDSAYRIVSLNRLARDGKLSGEFATTIGTSPRVLQRDGTFHFDCGDKGFGETMAYYFATSTQEYVQSLRFRSANPGQVRFVVDANPGNNSIYDAPTNTVSLSTDLVPDYQEADIIIHEYAHAIHSVINPPFGRGALSVHLAEGFADYLALSRTERFKPLSKRGHFAIWNAAGMHGAPEAIRKLRPSVKLSDVLGATPPRTRDDSLIEFWASVLWDIRDAFGADRGDSIALGHLFYISSPFSFSTAANSILQYNSEMYRGRDELVLKDIFERREIEL